MTEPVRRIRKDFEFEECHMKMKHICLLLEKGKEAENRDRDRMMFNKFGSDAEPVQSFFFLKVTHFRRQSTRGPARVCLGRARSSQVSDWPSLSSCGIVVDAARETDPEITRSERTNVMIYKSSGVFFAVDLKSELTLSSFVRLVLSAPPLSAFTTFLHRPP